MQQAWTATARKEQGDVYSSLFDVSPTLAEKWHNEVEHKLGLLMNFPEMGRIVPEKQLHFFREIFVGRYRLMYIHIHNAITVVAIRPMAAPLGKL